MWHDGAAVQWRNRSRDQSAWAPANGPAAALNARVCPWYQRVAIGSLCHVPDTYGDHHCLTSEDCGIDAGDLVRAENHKGLQLNIGRVSSFNEGKFAVTGNCGQRMCTSHGFCGTLVKNIQWIPNLANVLTSHAQRAGDIRVEIEATPE